MIPANLNDLREVDRGSITDAAQFKSNVVDSSLVGSDEPLERANSIRERVNWAFFIGDLKINGFLLADNPSCNCSNSINCQVFRSTIPLIVVANGLQIKP